MGVDFWDSQTDSYTQFPGDVGDLSVWDTGFLAGLRIPGVVDCDIDVERKIHVKNAPGADGATMTDQGYMPASVKIKITLWTPQQWNQFQQLIPLIQPRFGKPPAKPFDFVHPKAQLFGIKAVMIHKVSSPKNGSVEGTRVADIEALQWLPVKKKAVDTPTSALDVPTVATTQGRLGNQFTGGSQSPAGLPNTNVPPPSTNPQYLNTTG